MKRVDNLQENSLVTRITRARRDFDELKNSQRAGSNNVGIKRIATGNNVDFSTTITYHVITIWEVTITPTDSTFANSTFVWRVFWNGITSVGTGTAQTYTEVLPASAGGIRKARFYAMGMSPSASVTYGIRVVVYAIGNASLSIVQIV